MATGNTFPIGGRESLDSDPTRNFRFLVSFQPYSDLTGADMSCPNPLRNINFGFTSVSGLSMAIESIPYREGGMNTTLHQIPGQATFSPITLTRGVHLANSQGWTWIKRLFAALGPGSVQQPASLGYPGYQFRSAVTIRVLQHPLNFTNDISNTAYRNSENSDPNKPYSSQDDMTAVSFRFYNAWISALAYSDLNAGDNAIMVEQMTLVHEGMDMYWQPPKQTKGQLAGAADRFSGIGWVA